MYAPHCPQKPLHGTNVWIQERGESAELAVSLNVVGDAEGEGRPRGVHKIMSKSCISNANFIQRRSITSVVRHRLKAVHLGAGVAAPNDPKHITPKFGTENVEHQSKVLLKVQAATSLPVTKQKSSVESKTIHWRPFLVLLVVAFACPSAGSLFRLSCITSSRERTSSVARSPWYFSRSCASPRATPALSFGSQIVGAGATSSGAYKIPETSSA